MKRPGCAQVAHKSQRVGPRVNLSERAAHELDGRIHCTTAIHVRQGIAVPTSRTSRTFSFRRYKRASR